MTSVENPSSDLTASSSVLEKATEILTCLARTRSLGMSGIARETGLAKPTVHRLCTQLEALRFLHRQGTKYELGSRTFELGYRVPMPRMLRDMSLFYLQELSRATKATVYLAARQASDVVNVEMIQGRGVPASPFVIAGRFPMHCTATGKCLLAFGSDSLLDEVMRKGLKMYTPSTITAPNVLRTELVTIREQGYAHEREELKANTGAVGAPILVGIGSRAIGAIAACGSADLSANVRTRRAVVEAAAAISKRLNREPYFVGHERAMGEHKP